MNPFFLDFLRQSNDKSTEEVKLKIVGAAKTLSKISRLAMNKAIITLMTGRMEGWNGVSLKAKTLQFGLVTRE